MARGESLDEILLKVRRETGRADSPQVNQADTARMTQMINRTQKMLWKEHNWPHLVRYAIVPLQTGVRYYPYPADIDEDRCTGIHYLQGTNDIVRMDRGVTPTEYLAFNSLKDERNDPPMRYDVRDVDGQTRIEVWPIPATNTYELIVTGLRPLPTLIEADAQIGPIRSLLDGDMLALFVAAELLGEKGQTKAVLAQRMLHAELGNKNADPVRVAIGSRERRPYGNLNFAPRG